MDVRRMRQVLAIHRHGSFARAADEVGVSQPTLSKSIARLEDVLGVRLFDRSGSGAKVTPMGALIVERAERIVGETERLARDIEMVAQGRLGQARIGIGPALRPAFLPLFAEELVARHPRLRLEIEVNRRERLIADLHSGALDVALIAHMPDVAAQAFVATEILEEPMLAVVSPAHPLAQLKRVTARDLMRHPMGSGSLGLFAVSDIPGAAAMLARHEPMVVCNDDATLKRLAMRGLIALFANEHLLKPELDSGQLVSLDIGTPMSIRLVALTTRAGSHAPVLREIVELASDVCGRLMLGATAVA